MIIRWMVCVLSGMLFAMPLAAETPATRIEKFGNTPLVFEPNHGQTDPSVRFLSRGERYGLFLTDKEAIVSLAGATPALLRMELVGQNPHPQISGSDSQPGTSQYFKGSSPSKWQQAVPHFLKVDYSSVYPGIDLTYYGNQRQLEYDFTVAPHANPKSIEMKFSGMEKIEIGAGGDLILHTGAGDIRHQQPRVYQERNGVEERVEGQFILLGPARVGFRIGDYDTSLPLVIDPKFVYSTYFGGGGTAGDIGIDVKVDAFGATYVTGYTASMDFFSSNLSTTAPGGGSIDAFVMKVDPTGSNVLSAMYFGGSSDDEGHRIALDGGGNVYVTGYTTSSNFPIVNGFQTKLGGRKDAYIMKIDSAVSQILFSSYLGGSFDDQPFGLSVDSSGNIYVAGETLSQNFPLFRAIRSKFGGGLADAFVAKISSSYTLIYSTFLGGRGNDRAYDVTSDSDGDAFVVGFTSSPDFPTVNAIAKTFQGGSEDAFLTKLNPDGSAYLFSTYHGGAGVEEAVRVVLDSGGNIVMSGYTNSPNFPLKNAIQGGIAGEFDIFVTKFTPDASDAEFSTVIGSDGSESAPGLALDSADDIYLAGFTASFSFPAVNAINVGTTGGALHGGRDAYVMKLTPTGRIIFSTYIGGTDSDGAVAIAVDAAGSAYVTGYTFSTDFPVVNAFQAASAGASDGFLVKIDAADVVVTAPISVPLGGSSGLSTIGGSNSVQFAHATYQVPNGAKLPAGLAIIDLNQGGEVGEAAFPLLPFITAGRVYVNESASQQTNLAIVNPSPDGIAVNYVLTNRNGDLTTSGSFTIPPFSSFAQPVTAPPISLQLGSTGTLTFSSEAPVAAQAFRTFVEGNGAVLLTYLPIVDPAILETRPTTIPHFALDLTWGDEFILVNNTDAVMTGNIEFYNNGPGEGDPTLSSTPVMVSTDHGSFTVAPYTLQPRATDNFLLNGATDAEFTGYARIVPDPGTYTPVGSVILTYTSGDTVSLHATVEAQIPLTDFRMFDERSGDFDNGEGRATAMAFAMTNPSETPTTVTMTLVNMDGSATGLSTSFTLPARGHIATYLHRMAAFQNMPNPFQGLVVVHATGPGVAVFGMRGRISERGTFVGTTTSPIKENSNNGTLAVFPHILDGGGYATQFIFFSDPTGIGTSGTLSFADENGTPLPLNIQ